MAALVFSVLVTLLGIGFLWFYVARPILEDYGVIAPRAVNDYQTDAAMPARVMSRPEGQTVQTNQTDEPDGRVSVADQWLDRLEVDRTREAVVDLLVYSGWSVTDIRGANILRGDNALIGPEVEAARLRLGIVVEPRQLRVRDDQGERLIPIAP